MFKRLMEGWFLVFVLFSMASTADSRNACHNYRFGQKVTAHFDPHKCRDLDHARWRCDGVVFDPQVIEGGTR